MNFINNDVSYVPKFSQELLYSNLNRNNESARKNYLKKGNQSPNQGFNKTKTKNQYLGLYPKISEQIKQTVLSAYPDRETSDLRERHLKNTFISFHNPLRVSNNNKATLFHHQKKNKYDLKTSSALGETSDISQKRNTFNFFFPKGDSKKNLKLIQRELQFKLLDMSIQMENDSDNNEDFLSQEQKFQRQEKKRYTEYQGKLKPKNSNNNLKSFKTSGGKNNVNSLYLNPNKKSNNSLKSNQTDKSTNENVVDKPRLRAVRRQSYIPKNLLSKKFEEHNNNQIINKANMSVNMDLYRDLFPNLNMNKSDNDLTNINNRSMVITKKKVNIKKILLNSLKNEEFENKYRVLMRNKELYDSYEDEEVIEEPEDEFFYISPETYQIFIFDTLILLCTLFGSFYIPIYISQSKCFCSYMPKAIEYILFVYEFINIIDIFLSFFRAYYNFEFVLIKKNERIVKHYLKKYFFADLLAAIPFFTISYYCCNYYENKPDGKICHYNGIDMKYNFIKLLFGFKIVKLFKVLDKKVNTGINYFNDKVSENYTLEKVMKMFLFIIICVIGFNFFICYHIYIGRQSYPNWILKTNNQDASFLTIYISSFYFLIATITSVGYGDITCVSLSETFYQIIILTIGVIAYSWIVSTIGNYVKKESRAAIKFNKDVSLLEEIRVSYPTLNFKLYNKIYKHLETVSLQQEKLDTNLLVTNLPYTLKNQIMFVIYGSIIKKFKFFKDCENSDFILRVLTSFIPLSTKKGAFIIQEGEIIDNLVFVKEGRLSLVATIDLDDPIASINNYLGEKFKDINDKMNTKLDNSIMDKSPQSLIRKDQATNVLKTFLKTKEDIAEENIEQEMAKKDFNNEVEIGNLQFLNVLDILKNEHYGIVYMFLKKPAPLSLRVKSKYCQLFLLRKHDAMHISKAYPNVWKKIYKKSYHNMKSIKKLTQKIVVNYCRNYGYKLNLEDMNLSIDDINNKQNMDFLFRLGLLNSKQRRNTKRNISFNLDNSPNSNQNIKPKSILKKKNENNNYLGLNNNKFFMPKYKSFKSGEIQMNNKYLDSPTNFLSQQRRISNTNINFKNLSIFSNKISSSNYDDNTGKNKANQIGQINQINNHINYNIVINDADMNNDSKTLLNHEENKRNSFTKQSERHFGSIASFGKKKLPKVNIKQNDTSKMKNYANNTESKNNTSSSNTEIINKENKPAINNVITLKIPNINNNTNTNSDTSGNNTLELNDKNEKNSEKSINTINDLSKSLLKKVKKKIKKRQKRKKLYKMLLQKITESIAKVNPNLNLSTTYYNNSLVFSSKVGDMFSINPEFNDLTNEIIDEKPEIKSNISQSVGPYYPNMLPNLNINPNINTNTNININPFHIPINHEPPDLFLIPESLEFSSSESSSDNSNNSENKEREKKNDDSKLIKLNEIEPKKEVELSISKNTQFTLNTTYENLNQLSEGNYSKDENLQKSVLKLIQVYLSEKEKDKEKTEKEIKIKNNTNSNIKNSSIKSPYVRDNRKEKTKKEKEKDVWSFLNDDDNDEKSKNNSELKESFEKVYCKSPQVRHKKANDLAKRRRNRRIYDDLFNLEDTTINKKNYNQRKSRKSINKTTFRIDSIKKKVKKRKKTVKNLQRVENENKNNKSISSTKKEKDKDKENEKENDDMISSLELSDFGEGMEQKDNFDKYYKTYQKNNKEKNQEGVKYEEKSGNISNENNDELSSNAHKYIG